MRREIEESRKDSSYLTCWVVEETREKRTRSNGKEYLTAKRSKTREEGVSQVKTQKKDKSAAQCSAEVQSVS